MWDVNELEFREGPGPTLEGGGLLTATTVRARGVELMNMLECTEVELGEDGYDVEGALQVEVCRSCGIQRCEFGGWVQGRRVGASLAWFPVLGHEVEDEIEGELLPPRFLWPSSDAGLPSGAPLFSAACWAELHARSPQMLWPVERFPKLDSTDVARMVRFSAPWLFGRFRLGLQLRGAAVVAVDHGDLAARLELLQDTLVSWETTTTEVELLPADAPVQRLEFALEDCGYRFWSGLGLADGDPVLALSPTHVFRRVGESEARASS